MLMLASLARASAAEPVTRLSVTVSPSGSSSRVIVQLLNRARVDLDAWSIVLTFQTPTGESRRLGLAYDGATGDRPGTGPIRPGETRSRIVDVGTIPSKIVVTPQMALFADLTSQGDPNEVATVYARRRHQADIWSASLKAFESPGGEQLRRALQVLLTDDPQLVDDPSDPDVQSARVSIADLLEVRDPIEFQDRAKALQDRFVRRLNMAVNRIRKLN
jgi:hypothetical protein